MTNRLSPLLIVLPVLFFAVLPAAALPAKPASIELYSLFELALAGPTDTPTFNAFISVSLNATFTHTGGPTASAASAASAAAAATTTVRGFYDGAGRYVVRFMPSAVGTYSYATSSNSAAITDTHGTFQVTPITPSTVSSSSSSSYRGRQDPRNHGPARTSSQGYGFAYDDGTTYVPVGTTSYAWLHQPEGDALEELTLKSLAKSPFNKLRMTIFPKYYPFTHDEPRWCKCQRGGFCFSPSLSLSLSLFL